MSMETVPIKCACLPIDDFMSILFRNATNNALVAVMKIDWKLSERRKGFRVGVIEQAALLLTLQKLRFFVLGPIGICRASDVDAQNLGRADNSKGFSIDDTISIKRSKILKDQQLTQRVAPGFPVALSWKWIANKLHRIYE